MNVLTIAFRPALPLLGRNNYIHDAEMNLAMTIAVLLPWAVQRQ